LYLCLSQEGFSDRVRQYARISLNNSSSGINKYFLFQYYDRQIRVESISGDTIERANYNVAFLDTARLDRESRLSLLGYIT